MTYLLDENPEAAAWVDRTKAALSRSGAFGQLRGGVVWSDATGADGQLLVPGDPEEIAAEINADGFPLLKEHDPGFPIGKLLAAQVFTGGSGKRFVAAVLGYYEGARLSFRDLGLSPTGPVFSPTRLPALPDDCWINFATDPREVAAAWVEDAIRSAPLPIKEAELSHNAADVEAELIRVGVLFLGLVWVPFVTAIASEVGRDAYSKLHSWLRGLVHRLSKLRNPILEIQSHHNECYVSFLIRGKNMKRNCLAFDALPAAAAQAQYLIRNMKNAGLAPKSVVYEFHHQDDVWFPSYAELHDGQLVTDNQALIARERLPLGLSLGPSTWQREVSHTELAATSKERSNAIRCFLVFAETRDFAFHCWG